MTPPASPAIDAQPTRISGPDAWREALTNDEFPWNDGGHAANADEPNAVDVEG